MNIALKPAVHILLLLPECFATAAQLQGVPQGMFCGGNELRFEGELRTSKVTGVVLSYDGSDVFPHARIQVQIQGRPDILLDLTADTKGRFKLPQLRPGKYWLGISSPGFNLHYFDLNISRNSSPKKVRVPLSLGT